MEASDIWLPHRCVRFRSFLPFLTWKMSVLESSPLSKLPPPHPTAFNPSRNPEAKKHTLPSSTCHNCVNLKRIIFPKCTRAETTRRRKAGKSAGLYYVKKNTKTFSKQERVVLGTNRGSQEQSDYAENQEVRAGLVGGSVRAVLVQSSAGPDVRHPP